MKRLIAAVILTLGMASHGQVGHENAKHIVLPNPKLLGCRSSGCSQLWQESTLATDAIYPRQVIVDIFGDESCPLGILAIYEKSVSLDELKASIDEQYSQWALASNATSTVKLWRVEARSLPFNWQSPMIERRKSHAKSATLLRSRSFSIRGKEAMLPRVECHKSFS